MEDGSTVTSADAYSSSNTSMAIDQMEKGDVKRDFLRRTKKNTIAPLSSIQQKVPEKTSQISSHLLPFSSTRLTWEFVIFMAIWYNSIVAPIRLFIMTDRHTPTILKGADLAFDILFVLDATLHFYLPFIDDDTGQIIIDPVAIRKKYFGSFKFYANVLTCIPILKVPLSSLINSGDEIFIILRMIRIFNFKAQFHELKIVLLQSGPVNDSFFRMGVILFFTLLMMSVLGCSYFGLFSITISDICPSKDEFINVFLNSNGWVSNDPVITDVMSRSVCEENDDVKCDECPQGLFLVRSLYFLMQTLFTIGYGD